MTDKFCHRCSSSTNYLTGLTLDEESICSEAMLIDGCHEGHLQAFDTKLARTFPVGGVPLIAFEGLSNPAQLRLLLEMQRIVAGAVGDFVGYTKYVIQDFKRQFAVLLPQPAAYAAAY